MTDRVERESAHPEKRLFFHIFCVSLSGSQPPLWVPPQQLWDDAHVNVYPIPVPQAPFLPTLSFVVGRWGCAYPSHDANSLCRQEAGITDLIIDNAVKDLLLVVPGKRRLEGREPG